MSAHAPKTAGAGDRAADVRADPEAPPDAGKRRTLKKLAALGLLCLTDVGALSSCGRRPAPAVENKVIMLGIDGLDERITSRMMAAGQLPNLSRLEEMGGFRPVRSTIPSQSPSAWATVITGQDPGGHGICDIFHRDPKTYRLVPSIGRAAPPAHALPIGQWRLPLSQSRIELNRHGRAFWEILGDAGVPCEIHRVPSNFPPKDTGQTQIAGMGTPDMRGTIGECTFYTDTHFVSAEPINPEMVRVVDGRIRARLAGPRNSLKEGSPRSAVDFEVWLDRRNRVAKITIQGRQILLRQGEWSDWIPVKFPVVPGVTGASGICRFYMREVSPRFHLYVTPINLDPMDPPLPIDAPRGYARQLAERFGRFHTLGIPEDTLGLTADFLDEAAYLHQADLILAEARSIWQARLNEFQRGLLFYYFGTTDRNQHLFWRLTEPRHPRYDPQLARKYGGVVEDCYRTSDELVGEALEARDAKTTLIVFSDHGFAPFNRNVNLNGWLASQGYLAMTNQNPGASLLRHADWSRTYAYGVGMNAVYINLQGRERQGTVSPRDKDAISRRIASQLRKIRDPDTGENVVRNVYLADQLYASTIPEVTPDLIVGYASGYRCSSPSVVGTVMPNIVEDNLGKWSGDHCMDRAEVPGIVLASKPIAAEAAELQDITATALTEFGVPVPEDVSGKPLL